MTDPPDEPAPRLDAANRLERVIDAQSATLERIDDKSSRIARLLGILLGVVLSSLSLGLQFDGIRVDLLPPSVRLSFATGIVLLLSSLAAAIVTLLSSRLRIGLPPVAGEVLSDPTYEADPRSHFSRVVGAYAYGIRQNNEVIETNVRRLRRALVLFLLGEGYIGFSLVLFTIELRGHAAWFSFGILTLASVVVVQYVLSGRYLTLETGYGTNE